jgi:hypothetical protein
MIMGPAKLPVALLSSRVYKFPVFAGVVVVMLSVSPEHRVRLAAPCPPQLAVATRGREVFVHPLLETATE